MKLTFKSFTYKYIPSNGKLVYNGGIQYSSIKNLPFEIGDWVKHTKQHNITLSGISSSGESKIVNIQRTDGGSGHVILVLLKNENYSYVCCSWIKPLRHAWRKL